MKSIKFKNLRKNIENTLISNDKQIIYLLLESINFVLAPYSSNKNLNKEIRELLKEYPHDYPIYIKNHLYRKKVKELVSKIDIRNIKLLLNKLEEKDIKILKGSVVACEYDEQGEWEVYYE